MFELPEYTEEQKEQYQKEQGIKTCAKLRDSAFEKCANDIWKKWSK